MLDFIKKTLGFEREAAFGGTRDKLNEELLAAVLLLEAVRSDYECSEIEMVHVVETLKSMFNPPDEYIEELLEFARCDREKAADIFHYTRQVNEQMSRDQKLAIMEAVWRIIYADGKIDKYEAHFARKLMNLLWIDHKDFIEAKLKAKPK